MNVIAQSLYSRALRSDPGHDPHLLHGVLLMLEQGVGAPALGRLVGQPSAKLLRQADIARRGECVRAKPWMGERMVSEVQTELGRERIKGRELFLTAWHRVAIELMARPDGVLTGELNDVLAAFGRGNGGKQLQRLRAALNREGFASVVETDAVGRQSRYRFGEQDRKRVIALMDNGWVVL